MHLRPAIILLSSSSTLHQTIMSTIRASSCQSKGRCPLVPWCVLQTCPLCTLCRILPIFVLTDAKHILDDLPSRKRDQTWREWFPLRDSSSSELLFSTDKSENFTPLWCSFRDPSSLLYTYARCPGDHLAQHSYVGRSSIFNSPPLSGRPPSYNVRQSNTALAKCMTIMSVVCEGFL